MLSIGMTHPRNVAGLGVDAFVAADYGVPHVMAIAAVSAQDERGVQQVFPLPDGIVRDQLRAAGIAHAAVVRAGALGIAQHFDLLAHAAADRPVVLDPVLRSSAGGSLYVDDPLPALRGYAARSRAILTPNLEEARALTGMEIATVEQMIGAGKRLLDLGWRAVLLKGGHLAGDPVDVLADASGTRTFADTRLRGTMRGTGCTLAAALACELALGRDLATAVKGARAYLRAKLARL